jgi:hypothetical protein
VWLVGDTSESQTRAALPKNGMQQARLLNRETIESTTKSMRRCEFTVLDFVDVLKRMQPTPAPSPRQLDLAADRQVW